MNRYKVYGVDEEEGKSVVEYVDAEDEESAIEVVKFIAGKTKVVYYYAEPMEDVR